MITDVESIQFAMQSAGVGIWDVSLPELNVITWDDQCSRLYGYAHNQSVGYNAVIRCIHPDDVIAVNQAVIHALAPPSGGLFDETYRTIGANDGILRWVRFIGKCYFDERNIPKRFSGIAMEVTTEVVARQKAAKAEMMTQAALKGTGVGLFSIDIKSDEIDYSPSLPIILTGEQNLHLSRKAFVEHIHPDDMPLRTAAYEQALISGDLLYEARTIWNDNSVHFIRTVGTYSFDDDGKPKLFSGTVQDITDQRQKEIALKNAEDNFRIMVEQAPVAMLVFKGEDMIFEIVNPPMLELLGKSENIVGKSLNEGLPEIIGQPIVDILMQVYRTGESYTGYELPAQLNRKGKIHEGFFNFTFTPLFEDDKVTGILEVATDVTKQVNARKQLEESEKRFRTIIEEAPIATCLFVGRDLIISVANDKMIRFWGKDKSVIGQPLAIAVPELENQPFLKMLDDIFDTGEPHTGMGVKAELPLDGIMGSYYFDFTYQPLKDEFGKVYAIMEIATDVTEQALARQKVAEAEEALHGAIELAELGTWTYNFASGLFDYSFRLKDWYGFTTRESITIDKIRKTIKEPVELNVNFAVDNDSNGHYDEEYTIINPLTGRERIIHTLGTTFYNEHGVALKLVGTARDVTKQHKLQLALQEEVKQRTYELQLLNAELQLANDELYKSNERLLHSNEELEQYAYVASHDLQEPLRKIRLFSDMLGSNANFPAQYKKLLEKIIQSSDRMSLLINDLLEFSRLLKSGMNLKKVNLTTIANAVVGDFELLISEKKATVLVNELPIVDGIQLQMNQLFYNLLSNALKFMPPGRSPEITISANEISLTEAARYISKPNHNTSYYHIIFTDNGIGFENQLSDKIFEVFKRLHSRDAFAGSGIGLALCRRIVANHNGHIFASSVVGEGTSFHIILPETISVTKS